MGADGGTVPKRSEQIKQTRKEERIDGATRSKLRLTFCALSGAPLAKSSENLACDLHGNIFNLEMILECLVDAQKKPLLAKKFGIKKMKDVIKLRADLNKDFIELKDPSETFVPPFVCPFTGHLSNGIIKFVVLRPCGHLMSQKALREMTDDGLTAATASLDVAELSKSPSTQPPIMDTATQSSASSISSTTLSASAVEKCCPVCQMKFSHPSDIIAVVPESEAIASTSEDKPKDKKRSHSNIATTSSTPVPRDENPPSPKKSKVH